jgi:hypothetical protein
VPHFKPPFWRRKRSWQEFLILVQRLAELDGTATQESVLHDPPVVKWMSEQRQTGGGKPRLWGYTKEVALLSTLIDAEVGKSIMKRPDIPGDVLRQKNVQNKLKNTLSRIGVQQG